MSLANVSAAIRRSGHRILGHVSLLATLPTEYDGAARGGGSDPVWRSMNGGDLVVRETTGSDVPLAFACFGGLASEATIWIVSRGITGGTKRPGYRLFDRGSWRATGEFSTGLSDTFTEDAHTAENWGEAIATNLGKFHTENMRVTLAAGSALAPGICVALPRGSSFRLLGVFITAE